MKTRIVNVITIPYLLSLIIIKVEYKIIKRFFRYEVINGERYVWGGLYGVIIKTHGGKRCDN